MKKVLLTLLAAVLIIGVLAGAGFAGYRVGYSQGAQASANGNAQTPGRPENFGPDGPPFQNFGRDFDRGFNHGFPRQGFQMMHRGRGFGIFSPFMFLGHIAVWGILIWLVYLLFTRSGLRLSLTKQPVQNTPATIETEAKPQDQKSENE